VKKEYGGAWSTIASAEEKVKPEIKTVSLHRIDSQLFNTRCKSCST